MKKKNPFQFAGEPGEVIKNSKIRAFYVIIFLCLLDFLKTKILQGSSCKVKSFAIH